MMSCGSKKRIFLGIDTSCYTTSAACVCVNGNSAEIVCDERTLLKVAAGERGLRQSDAVFQHVRNLAEILPKIFKQIDRKDVAGVGVSVCPSGREGSYMPVFLAGKSHALSVSAALGVPVYEFTHQQGHIRAAAFDNESLLGKGFLRFISAEEQVNCSVSTAHFPISKKSAVQPTSTQVSLWTGSGSQWVCDFLREKNLKKLRLGH